MSTALDRLTASFAALSTAVAAKINAPAPDDSDALNALADRADALTASLTPAATPAPEEPTAGGEPQTL